MSLTMRHATSHEADMGGFEIGFLITAILAAAAQTTATGFSIHSANESGKRARQQRDEQRALQSRALTEEEFTRRKEKDRKKSADAQAEMEASLANPIWSSGVGVSGTVLGSPSGSKTVLGV